MEFNLIALDVGEKRVGVAAANTVARLANPLTTLVRDDSFWPELEKLLTIEQPSVILVGLPRNLSGDDTAQTTATRVFITELGQHTDVPIETQDEALTSRQAEAELQARGKQFAKADIDALAATYILEDYLRSQETYHAA
ncbi:MAG TPA: Holliday junction resolvase RuvX [Verrucomicrobiae bacterium]|nr:Holliday junction resolvase RuvX [Verrucomicrobiae bacterium]